MCDFNQLSEDEKAIYHEKLLACANNFGGKNFFLHLLEAIRETKPHPLTAGNMSFDIELGSVTWNKVIFNDKLQLLIKARKNESKQDNLLPNKDEKNYKKILNVVRTLKPIVFHVTPANPEEGKGFFFQAFDMIDETTTKLNPLFDAIFFCSIDTVKKFLNYTPKV
jgi:hypothetical protein